MKLTETKLAGLVLIDVEPHHDDRGMFARLHCQHEFKDVGIDFDPVQMNLSTNSHQHSLRGMHYKPHPHAEAKVVRVMKGHILDVIVDIRRDSPTFLQHLSVELSEDNMRAVYIPEGFAHGFLTLTDDSHVLYQMGRAYEPGNEAGLRWNDPALAIDWLHVPSVINERDANYPLLEKNS